MWKWTWNNVHKGFLFRILHHLAYKIRQNPYAWGMSETSKVEEPNGWDAGGFRIEVRWSCILAIDIEFQLHENDDMIGFHNLVGKNVSHVYMVPLRISNCSLAPRSKPHGWFALRPRRWPMSWRKMRSENLRMDLALGLFPNAAMDDSTMSQILTLSVGRCRVAA